MMLLINRPVVVINHAAAGFHVEVPVLDINAFFEDRMSAQACARLVAAVSGYGVSDCSATMPVSAPVGDDRVGYDASFDIVFCGSEAPVICGDEILDFEEAASDATVFDHEEQDLLDRPAAGGVE